MPQYRLYCLNDHGGFAKSHEIEASSDADALAQAHALKLEVFCELWSRNRFIAKLPPHHGELTRP
jgi:hypothetical protein